MLRFNVVLIFLLGTGVLGAFVLPPGLSATLQGRADLLLMPVSRPVRAAALAVSDRLGGAEKPSGPARTRAELEEENKRLLTQVAALDAQLAAFQQRDAQRTALGPSGQYCESFAVSGGDAGGRASLSLAALPGSSTAHLEPGQPVLNGYGLVGRIANGVRVQLLTDVGFRVTASFGRFAKDAFLKLDAPPIAVGGDGRGRLRISQLSVAQVKQYGLAQGDWVMLDDHEGWPMLLQGQKLGQIETIVPQPRKPLFADIVVRPSDDLAGLREVMVMTGR